jgi:hypothetical protein
VSLSSWTGPDGKEEGLLLWLNMLKNGMPPAGSAFTGDMRAEVLAYDMMVTMQDPNIFVKLGPNGSYIRVGVNVDDLLVVCKPKPLFALFVEHMQKRWEVKISKLDGWLNIEF